MEKNQKINCTVESCKYNNKKCQECELGQIVVTPILLDVIQSNLMNQCVVVINMKTQQIIKKLF